MKSDSPNEYLLTIYSHDLLVANMYKKQVHLIKTTELEDCDLDTLRPLPALCASVCHTVSLGLRPYPSASAHSTSQRPPVLHTDSFRTSFLSHCASSGSHCLSLTYSTCPSLLSGNPSSTKEPKPSKWQTGPLLALKFF